MIEKGSIEVFVEDHEDGVVAYAIGIAGACVGQTETYDECLAEVCDALAMHTGVSREEAGPDEG